MNSPLTPLSDPTVPTGNAPNAIAVDPRGQYVYVLNSVDDTVSQYAIGPGGALNPLSTPVIASESGPASIAADPTGPYVYVANETSGYPLAGWHSISVFEKSSPLKSSGSSSALASAYEKQSPKLRPAG